MDSLFFVNKVSVIESNHCFFSLTAPAGLYDFFRHLHGYKYYFFFSSFIS